MTARLLVNFGALCCILAAQWFVHRAVARRIASWTPVRRYLALSGVWFVFLWLTLGLLLSVPGIYRRAFLIGIRLPSDAMAWLGGGAYVWAFLSTGVFCARRLTAAVTPRDIDPSRRRWMQSAAACVPVGATGYGLFIERTNFDVREVDLPIAGLAPDLHNLRIAQISDIHLSPFLSERQLARIVDAANETRPALTVVTGDLISRRGDPLDNCLRELSRLRATAGVYGCHGNHEIYAQCEDYATQAAARYGIRFLRMQADLLKFGAALLNLAGVDYQANAYRDRYLAGAERLRPTTLPAEVEGGGLTLY